MDVTLRKATMDDAQLLWDMQRTAFRTLYERYRDEGSPYLEPIESTQGRLMQPVTHYYVILADGQPVGGIRVRDFGAERDKILGPLYVLPERRGEGIAQRAIRLAEDIHGGTGWFLDTIEQEKGNCHLYEKLGYRRTGGSHVINERMTLVDYQK